MFECKSMSISSFHSQFGPYSNVQFMVEVDICSNWSAWEEKLTNIGLLWGIKIYWISSAESKALNYIKKRCIYFHLALNL